MFDSCICIEMDDIRTLLSRNRRIARKPHTCGECNAEIEVGEEYEIDATVFEKDFETFKTCLPCLRVRNSLFRCGWFYGYIWDEIHKSICDREYCVCPDSLRSGRR